MEPRLMSISYDPKKCCSPPAATAVHQARNLVTTCSGRSDFRRAFRQKILGSPSLHIVVPSTPLEQPTQKNFSRFSGRNSHVLPKPSASVVIPAKPTALREPPRVFCDVAQDFAVRSLACGISHKKLYRILAKGLSML